MVDTNLFFTSLYAMSMKGRDTLQPLHEGNWCLEEIMLVTRL
jgi:hypothetical protein